MSKNPLSALLLFILGSILILGASSGKIIFTNQDGNIDNAFQHIEKMRAEIQGAKLKLAKAREGDDLASLTLTTKSVPNLKKQLISLSGCIKKIQQNHRSSSEVQNLSSDLLKAETILKELDRVANQNLKSASLDQLNKLSLALDKMEQSLSEAKNSVVQSDFEDLKKFILGDIQEMRREVKDAFNRLAKAEEGDDLYKICITRKNLPNLKKQYESLSEKITEAEKTLSYDLSSAISKIRTILEELERVADANLKADTEAQLKKLSDSLIAFRSKINKEINLEPRSWY